MYTCERCGTRFGRPAATLESCPRCLVRDGVRVRLTGRLPVGEPTARRASKRRGLEAAVRERLAATAPEMRRAPAGG